MKKKISIPTVQTQKVALLGIHAPYNKTHHIQSYYEEFLNLVKSNNIAHDTEMFIKLRDIHPAYFLGKGKLDKLKDFCCKNEIDEIIVSEPLTGLQERNLSDYLDCKVSDRTNLILEIFEKSAHSAEGKTQVEIAMLQYKKTRLAGKGIHFSQQSGVRGKIGGAGETAKEKETRVINQYIQTLQNKLEKLQKVRATQRKQRLLNNVPHICLIGYTNAGKSTILNALTNSNVLADDKLFATLDTTTRELYVNGTKKGIISDSVGFIQQLPHHLIEAFKSTLQELQFADLLLHVVDISDPNWETQIKVVREILEELHIDKDMLYIFNKIDKLETTDLVERNIKKYQPYVVTCARSKTDIANLINFLSSWDLKSQK